MVRETIKEVLYRAQKGLKENNIESYYIDSLILLCFVLNCDKAYLTIYCNNYLNKKQIEKYFKLISLRKKNMPVKYITGICEFMSLDFYVNRNVLIPRPDTEILVEEAIKKINGDIRVKILDLCCGSGCIGISICHYLKNADCLMYDISRRALKVAKKNIIKHNLNERIKLKKGNVLSLKIKDRFDLIVSNPPYINERDYYNLEDDVKLYEPKIALLSEYDEFKFYRAIINNFSDNLKSGGYLLFEVSYNQSEYISQVIIESKNFKDIEIIKDLNGIDRVLIAKKI